MQDMVISMKQVFLGCLIATFCVASATAQARTRYRYDNYDTRDGVRVEAVPNTGVMPVSGKATPAAESAASIKGANSRPSSPVNASPRSSAMTTSTSLDGFTTGDAKTDSFIAESSRRNGIDPALIYAQMHQESSFKPRAISYKGARGLMQLMPATAARFGVANIFEPRQNIEGGARYMRFLLVLQL